MWNAVNKSLAIVLIAAAVCACTNPDAESAAELYTQAQTDIDGARYTRALEVLDTLNARYPDQTGVRRDALRLRALAMQGIAQDSLSKATETLAQATLTREEWQPRFRHVDSSVGLEGYFLPAGTSEKMMTTTGLQGRVSDKGFFYIVANVQGKAIGLQRIEFADGAESTSSEAISPSRIIRVEGSESASFNPEDLEGIGLWLQSHPKASKIVFKGTKGTASAKLTDALRRELTDCYNFSLALQAQRQASLRCEKYERMLATARDQLANLPSPAEKK